MTYRPVPGKWCVDLTGPRLVRVAAWGASGAEWVEVRRAGSYGARVRLPPTCIRPLTDAERVELSELVDFQDGPPRRRRRL